MELQWLGDNQVFRGPRADVAIARERSRQRRLGRIALPGALLCLWMWLQVLRGDAPFPARPHLSGEMAQMAPLFLLVFILTLVLVVPLLAAAAPPTCCSARVRSPRPSMT